MLFKQAFRRFSSSNQQYQYFGNRTSHPLGQNKVFLKVIGAGGILGISYYVYHLETVPMSGRRRFMDVSKDTENRIGKMAYQQMMSEYQHAILPKNHPIAAYVAKVANNLIKVTDLADVQWEVNVINSNQKNAFVMPGGKIFVFTGILPVTANEAGLAAVLAHEIGHQVARHSAEKMSWTNLLMVARAFLSLFLDTTLLFNGIMLELGFLRPFSRQLELEADYLGLQLMAKACYNPHAAIEMWQRMKMADDHKAPEYISTHPSNDKRIEKIQEWLPEANRIKNMAGCSDFDLYWNILRTGEGTNRFY